MNIFISFFNNNSILFFSWFCIFFYFFIESILPSYLGSNFLQQSYFIMGFHYLLATFVIFSILYSFYQSIKNININRIYAFLLLVFYFVVWIFILYNFWNGISSITKFFLFTFINVCICLYNLFKNKNIIIIIYLMFYGSNFILPYFLITNSGIHL